MSSKRWTDESPSTLCRVTRVATSSSAGVTILTTTHHVVEVKLMLLLLLKRLREWLRRRWIIQARPAKVASCPCVPSPAVVLHLLLLVDGVMVAALNLGAPRIVVYRVVRLTASSQDSVLLLMVVIVGMDDELPSPPRGSTRLLHYMILQLLWIG